MSKHPYIDIDATYSNSVNEAVAEHEQAVKAANEHLAAELENIEDPEKRASILAEFDREIQPARDAYEKASADAEKTRHKQKQKIKPTEGEIP